MKNRFNLNEEEKNRIRDLHGINILSEQKEDKGEYKPDPFISFLFAIPIKWFNKDNLSSILDCTISKVSTSNSESTQLVKSSAVKEGL